MTATRSRKKNQPVAILSLSRAVGMRKPFLLLMKHSACNILKLLHDKLYIEASVAATGVRNLIITDAGAL